METTISMNTVLNILHSMSLSTSNKRWLAEHLFDEVRTEENAESLKNSSWPKIRREDMHVAPEVADLVKGFELPDDVDEESLKLDYLLKKHG